MLGDRGTVRMELDDVKRFDSGVVLLTYVQRLDHGFMTSDYAPTPVEDFLDPDDPTLFPG